MILAKSFALTTLVLVSVTTSAAQVKHPAPAAQPKMSDFNKAVLHATYAVTDVEPGAPIELYAQQVAAAQREIRDVSALVTNSDEDVLSAKLFEMLQVRRSGRTKSIGLIEESAKRVNVMFDEMIEATGAYKSAPREQPTTPAP